MNLPFQVEQEVKETFKPPHLRFEDSSIKDNSASLEAGRAVFHPCIKVYIRAPGDDKCEVPYIVEQKVKDPITGEEKLVKPWEQHLKEKLHHKFIERQYYDFCIRSIAHWKENQETMVDGTPIGEWALLSKAECDNLKALGILSIEQCSQMTEEALSAYGLGARTLKEKAGNFLTANSNPGRAAEKINALEANLNSAVQKAEEAMNLMGGYEAKIKQLEQMVIDQSKPQIVTKTEVVYEDMEVDALVDAVKAKGFPMAHKGWSKDALIAKLRD